VQIERIQKCVAAAAAAAEEKFSWSKKVFLPLTCYNTDRHHTERYIWNERRSVSFMSTLTGQQSLPHFCADLQETILHLTIVLKFLRNGSLPMQISYQISLSNMCIFVRTGNFYITTIWVNLNRKTVLCVQRPLTMSTCMCTVSSSWQTFSLECRMSAAQWVHPLLFITPQCPKT
jgi:hypothetical protein